MSGTGGWLYPKPAAEGAPGDEVFELPLHLLGSIPDTLNREFIAWPGSDELVVTFSHAAAFALRLTPFRRNLLCLVDRASNYYTVKAQVTARAISAFVTAATFRKVVFIGSSKGAYGALLVGGLCAQIDRQRHWRALAFSPPTALYPSNGNLNHLPSYRAMLARAEKHPGLRTYLERYGDLSFIQWMRNFYAVIPYGEGSVPDRTEVERISAPNIRKYPVPYPLHNAITLFDSYGQSPDDIRRRIALLLRGSRKDKDFIATNKSEAKADAIVKWIFWNRWAPSLLDLVEEVMAVDIMSPQRLVV